MKKTIAAILLSALLILVCAFALSACNPTANVTGNWIGYLEGNGNVQVYFSARNNGSVAITERRAEYFCPDIDEVTRNGKLKRMIFRDFVLLGAYDKQVRLELSKGNITLDYKTDEGKFVFKRTELSLSEWRQQAFTFAYDDSTLPGEVFAVYKPLYYSDNNYGLSRAISRRKNFEDIVGKICFGFGQLRVNLSDFSVSNIDSLYFLEVQTSEYADSAFDITLTRIPYEAFDKETYVVKTTEVETVRSPVYYDSTQKKFFTGDNLVFGKDDTVVSLCGEIILDGRSDFEIRNEDMADDEFIAFIGSEIDKQDVQNLADGKVSFLDFFDGLWFGNKT